VPTVQTTRSARASARPDAIIKLVLIVPRHVLTIRHATASVRPDAARWKERVANLLLRGAVVPGNNGRVIVL